ncbi:MAG TPA: RodZ domain-containing protein [Actinomycetota bacterium]|nr:RodZ domain-containing protein [Actinomycetota bacterium]
MSQTSIGERLRQAREAIPASLAEASRATRVRVDFLEAMERDSFTFISGRVYVVGMLRSYARWLRLDEAEIAREYDRIYGAAEAPALAESLATRNERSMPVQRPRKPQWAMAAAAAIAIIAVLLLFSLLGGGGNVAAPPPVPSSPTPTPTITPTPTPSVVGGFNGVQLVVSVTGTSSWMRVVAGNTTPQLVAFQGTMQQGVTRTFSAVDLLRLQIANLGAVRVSLNGKDLGPLGQTGQTGSYIVNKGDAALTPDPSTTVPPPGQRIGPVVYPFRSAAPPPHPAPPPPSPSLSPTPSP